jgi:hypothetical protein
MLHERNSVVIFYRIRLTGLSIFTSLSSNVGQSMGRWVSKACRLAGAFLGGALLVSACASLDSRPATEVVKERSQARWESLVKGENAKTYEYLSPTARKTLRLEDYTSNMRTGFWKAVTVDKVACDSPDVCVVSVTVEYDHNKMGRNRSPLQETWIREGSNWWYAQK